MEGERKDCISPVKKYLFVKVVVIALLLVLTAEMGRQALTKEETKKVQKTNSQQMKVENPGYQTMEENPLSMGKYPEVSGAVEEYFEKAAGESKFVEAYEGIESHIKLGRYKDTYVVFVRYDMKIKDIYTKVPGLGTLYVDKKKDSSYRVSTEAKEAEVRTCIEELAQHTDVQQLFADTQSAYHAAVQSDALLQEALMDLKNAYEDSTGS